MSESKSFTTGEILTATATVGGGIWGIWEKILKPTLNKSKRQKKELYDMIASIHSELKFNGGGSIKDAIWELKRSNEKIITRLDGMDEFHKMALNIQGQLFWLTDENGGCIYASPALCRNLGYAESDLLGNNWFNIVTHGDRKRIFDAWDFSVKNKVIFDETYTIKNGDGFYQKVLDIRFHKSSGGTLGKVELIDPPFK